MSSDLEILQSRVARLEAKDDVLNTLNQYLYSLDTGFKDAILDCFTEHAVLDVPNFPGADGDDLHFNGKSQIAPLYEPYSERAPRIGGGHHSANIAINIDDDLQTAKVSAYFMTGTANGVQGGRYEGLMQVERDGKWRWQKLSITSAWGWTVPEHETVSESVGLEYSPFDGRPATYQKQ